jgi:hypothetical protein
MSPILGDVGAMGCTGPRGPGGVSCKVIRHLHSPAEALAGGRGLAPRASLTAVWMLLSTQVLGEMCTSKKQVLQLDVATSKKQVLQSIAGAFPANAELHKWRILPSYVWPPSRNTELFVLKCRV